MCLWEDSSSFSWFRREVVCMASVFTLNPDFTVGK
jgi:hypothetical protein